MKTWERRQAAEKCYAYPKGCRTEVRKVQGGKCAVSYCRQRKGLGFHHLVPRDMGGLTEPDNLMLLCKTHHDMAEISGKFSRRGVLHFIDAHDYPKRHFVGEGDCQTVDTKTAKTLAGVARAWTKWTYGGSPIPHASLDYLIPVIQKEIDEELNTRRAALREKIKRRAAALYGPLMPFEEAREDLCRRYASQSRAS